MFAKESLCNKEKLKNENKCLIAPFNSLPFYFFKTSFPSRKFSPCIFWLLEHLTFRVCVCPWLPRSGRRSQSSKELFRKRFISPLAQFSEHLCVALCREENITKTLSNYRWPLISLALLQPGNEHPCLRIVSFFSSGAREVIPTELFMKPELAERV